MSIIMRATLHDHAPNTYYGQWPGGKAAVRGPRSTVQWPRRGIGSVAFQRRSGSRFQMPKESRLAPREVYGSRTKKIASGARSLEPSSTRPAPARLRLEEADDLVGLGEDR